MKRTPYYCKGHIPIYVADVLYVLVSSGILPYLIVTHPNCFTFMLTKKRLVTAYLRSSCSKNVW